MFDGLTVGNITEAASVINFTEKTLARQGFGGLTGCIVSIETLHRSGEEETMRWTFNNDDRKVTVVATGDWVRSVRVFDGDTLLYVGRESRGSRPRWRETRHNPIPWTARERARRARGRTWTLRGLYPIYPAFKPDGFASTNRCSLWGSHSGVFYRTPSEWDYSNPEFTYLGDFIAGEAAEKAACARWCEGLVLSAKLTR